MSKFAIMSITLAFAFSASFAGQDTQFDLMRAVLLENFPEHKTIVGQRIGGIHATLDYMDWEWYLGTLEDDDQPACQSAIESRIGSKSLSLLEVNGHCDTFYYPNVDGGYHQCVFCAD